MSEDDEVWMVSTPEGGEASEYAEVLLLDKKRPRRIVRAYPFRHVPPQRLVLREGAVYCGRAGDGGMPDSMVCRIDRDTLDIVVRLYPHDPKAPWVAEYPDRWSVADGYLEMYDLEANDNGLWSKSFDGTWTRLDPSTLRVVERGIARPNGS